MAIPAGQRDQLVTIQAPVTTADALGQPIPTWQDVATVWARARPLRGKEFTAAAATQSEASVVFGLNWRSDITSAMRVVWRSVPYAIVADPIDVDGGRHTTELICAGGLKGGAV